MRRAAFSRRMAFGEGTTATDAMSARRTWEPDGVSSSSFSMSLTLPRVAGVLHTCTSKACPSRKMSPTSSPAINVDAGPPDVTGLDPVALGRREVDLHLELGDVLDELDVLLDHAVDVGEDRLDLIGLGPQHVEVRAEDADHDGVARAGQHLADAFLEVGLHVPLEARVAVDDLLDLGEGLVVVGFRRHADPVLAEVDAHDLVGHRAWPMWAPKLRTPGMAGSSLLASVVIRDLLRQRRARRGEPVHEEVPLLEVGQELLVQAGHDDGPGEQDRRGAADRRRGSPHDAVEAPAVAPLEERHDRRRAVRDLAPRHEDQAERRRHDQRDGHRDDHREARRRTPAAGRTPR